MTALAERLRRDGCARLPDVVAPQALEALRAESQNLRASATTVETSAFELHADGQDFRSPVRFHTSVEGDVLRAIHESRHLCALASDVAATPMRPSKAAYLFYETDDHIGLHTDLPACELVLLAALDAGAPPLVIHPDLRSLTPEELADVAIGANGAPPGGVEIPLDDSAVVALFGGGLPHQTRPVGARLGAAVATFCYVGAAEEGRSSP
jgi:hypothetical protein